MFRKLLLFLVFCPILSFAQTIMGTVISEKDNLPIDNTNVYALSSKAGTVTDKNGKFSLNVKSKLKNNEVLEISHVGYTTIRVTISYLAEQNFKIYMTENTENLSPVVVMSTLKLQPKLLFKELKPLKYAVFSFGSFIKDEKIYVMGGDGYPDINWYEKLRSERADFSILFYLSSIQTFDKRHYKKNLSIYDIKTDTWTTPKLKLTGRAHHNMHYYNNSIYILGGTKMLVNSKSSWEYLQNQIDVVNIDNLTSKTDYTNPHQASNFASFNYKDNIIVLGGSISESEDGKKVFTNKTHLYDITTGLWHELPEMPTAKETTGALVGDKIYLIGGNNGKPLSEIETFDLISGKWQTEGQIFLELERPAVANHDNTIYFFEDRKMCTYDVKTSILKEYEIDIESKFSSMYYDNNKLYLLGGELENSYSKVPSSKFFSIDLEEFKNTRPNKIKTLSQGVTAVKTN